MGNKNQGEGDYEAARRYDELSKNFVDRKQAAGDPLKGDAAAATEDLTAEERAALTHAKRLDQDERDAALFRALEAKR
jgi:hypothetical protein